MVDEAKCNAAIRRDNTNAVALTTIHHRSIAATLTERPPKHPLRGLNINGSDWLVTVHI